MAKSSVVLLFSGSILGREYMEDKDCVNSWISVKIVWGSGLERTLKKWNSRKVMEDYGFNRSLDSEIRFIFKDS